MRAVEWKRLSLLVFENFSGSKACEPFKVKYTCPQVSDLRNLLPKVTQVGDLRTMRDASKMLASLSLVSAKIFK
jgi:hypothetical protein